MAASRLPSIKWRIILSCSALFSENAMRQATTSIILFELALLSSSI